MNCGRGDTSFRSVQLAVAFFFSIAYYFLIWTPAMVDEDPKVEDLVDRLAPARADKDADTPLLLVALPYLGMLTAFSGLVMYEPAEERSSVAPGDDREDEKE